MRDKSDTRLPLLLKNICCDSLKKLKQWQALTPQQPESFPPICSDFVIELRSGSDLLERLPEKMQEYLNRGLALGWLIDPQNQPVKIYRLNQSVEVVSLPAHLSREDILSRFV